MRLINLALVWVAPFLIGASLCFDSLTLTVQAAENGAGHSFEESLQIRASEDFYAGRLTEARAACEQMIIANHYDLGNLGPDAIRPFLNRTICDITLGDLSTAHKCAALLEKYLRRASARDINIKEKNWLLADCLMLRAEISYRNGEYKNVGAMYSEALRLYTERFGALSPPLASAYEGLAVCLRKEGRIGAAVAAQREAAHTDFADMGLSYRFCQTLRFLIQLEYEGNNGERAEVMQDLLVTSLRAGMAKALFSRYEHELEAGKISAAAMPAIRARIERFVVGQVSAAEVKEKVAAVLGLPVSVFDQAVGVAQVYDFDHWISARRQTEIPPMLVKIEPTVPQKAVIYCIHGLGLHGSSFDLFAQKMANLGYPVLLPDIRGFGSNTHQKGLDKLEPEESLRDIHRSLLSLRKLTPDVPVILLGESMGGALALQAAAKDQDLLAALVCSVPSGMRFGGFSDSMKVARGILRGKNEIDVGKMIVHKVTSDKESQERWQADPQARLTLSPKELVKFQEFMDQNTKAAKAIDKLPVVYLQGAQDSLVKPMGTGELFLNTATKDKDLLVVGLQEHLIFEDENCPAWLAPALAEWIQNKLSNAKLYRPR